MARQSIRSWFQFGILDLLLVVVFVATVTATLRPAQGRTTARSLPYLVGNWKGCGYYFGTGTQLNLEANGKWYYERLCRSPGKREGTGWQVTRHSTISDAFVLMCSDDHRLVIRPVEAIPDLVDGGIALRATSRGIFAVLHESSGETQTFLVPDERFQD